MSWKIFKNGGSIPLKDIPALDISHLKKEMIDRAQKGCRVIAFWGVKENRNSRVTIILADDIQSRLLAATVDVTGDSYPSLTPDIPAFHLFERALYEESGIEPVGHPWLKPVRFPHNPINPRRTIDNYPFFKMDGENIHEVGVGPIHAGVIEPGHFRFMCHGERIYHLEIQLGYQHRGLEQLFLNHPFLNHSRFLPYLAEGIASDSVIGHTSAYCQAIESLTQTDISKKAMTIRAIALELERLAVHIGDLAALANDIAYLMGNAVFGALRTSVINTSLSICGSRFGKGLIRPGGVTHDIDLSLRQRIKGDLQRILKEVSLIAEAFFTSASCLARLEKTGIVSTDQALAIGMVGMAARASGVPLDIRSDHPFGIYQFHPIHKMTLSSGDVFARGYIRYLEIQQSIRFIFEQLELFPDDEPLMKNPETLAKGHLTVSLIEGWRGEILHVLTTDEKGKIAQVKIKDPSFNNWMALSLAVRNHGISDFPLCNKSFNLSYSGHDL